MNGHIYIPTMGRTTCQRTFAELPMELRDCVRFVCPPEEVKALEARYHAKALACPVKGIAKTRQWIVEQSPTRLITMVDDDQWFYGRIDGTTKLKRLKPAQVGQLFEDMEALCMIYPMVGLSARQGNNNHDEDFVAVASRVHNHYALDTHVMKEQDIRFDTTHLMEDFYVNLRLLLAGFPTAKVVDRCWNQPQSNSKGGCSTYRDAALQEQASMFLGIEFPEVVEVVEKKTKHGWFGGEGKRYDVRIQWKKAHAIGRQRNNA